jgi:hypothetical protein
MRGLAKLGGAASLALALVVGWRWFRRTTNTQVHRINQ